MSSKRLRALTLVLFSICMAFAGTGEVEGLPRNSSEAPTSVAKSPSIAGAVAPSALAYAANPVFYTVGLTITPNRPSSAGGAVVSYSVSPALPLGLILNTTSGVISGKPTTATPAANYTITATNATGSTQALLR